MQLNFSENRIVTGKYRFFVKVPFCTSHSFCLRIGCWQGSLVWKNCAFNLEMVLQCFEKGLLFLKNFFQNFENVQNFQWFSHKNMPIPQTESFFKNLYHFLQDPLPASFKVKSIRRSVSLY